MSYQAFDLSGKVALITGGNGGIGLGMAKALASAGADICIWGTNQDKNAKALAELQSFDCKSAELICDVSDEAAVNEAFAKTLSIFGRIDTCIANAGVSGTQAGPFIDMSSEEWHRIIRINLDGVFYTLRSAAKHMVERAADGDAGGRLAVTASLAALAGAPRNEHYAASKGAVVSMIHGLAVELARYGITANSILPGWIDTDMTAGVFANEKFSDHVIPRIPMRRYGNADDFGGIAIYLASDASSYHTAESFVIDGGYWRF